MTWDPEGVDREVPIPVIPYRCGTCSAPIKKKFQHLTGRCRDCHEGTEPVYHAHGIDKVWSLTTYVTSEDHHPGTWLVQQKDSQDLTRIMMRDTALLFLERDPWPQWEPSWIVPCPSSRDHGYPRSLTMARTVADVMGDDVADPLSRVDDGTARSAIRGKEMPDDWQGVLSKMEIDSSADYPPDAKVLLVDDSITHGVTAANAAHALRESGVDEVRLLTFAKTVSKEHLREHCD